MSEIFSISGLYPLDPSNPDNQNVSKHCQLSSGKGESAKSLKTTSLNRPLLLRTRRCSARKRSYYDFKIPARSPVLCQALSHVITTNNSVTSHHSYFKGNEFEAEKESDLSKVTKLSYPSSPSPPDSTAKVFSQSAAAFHPQTHVSCSRHMLGA